MKNFAYARGWGINALIRLIAFSGASICLPVRAEILDQPARLSRTAPVSLQLSVARTGTRLVSVGERGIVLLSDDHGKSWRQVQAPVSVTLTRVAFADDRRGWAVGHSGAVLYTADGGETWTRQFDGLQAAKAEAAAAAAEADGGPQAQRRQADVERLLVDGPDKPFLALTPVNGDTAWAVGAYGLAFVTGDGGRQWRSVMGRLAAGNGRHLYAAHIAGDTVILAGEQGTILRSEDGGRQFGKAELPAKGTLFGLVATKSGSALVAFGLKGNVFRSSDQGRRWERLKLPPLSFTAGTRLTNGALVLSDEAGQLYRSEDEGASFALWPTKNPVPTASLIEAADGALIRAGVRGVGRVEPLIEVIKP